MDYFKDDFGLSGLTQVSNVDAVDYQSDKGYDYVEEDLIWSNVVSLEEVEVEPKQHVLYDDIVAQDISSDEEVDSM